MDSCECHRCVARYDIGHDVDSYRNGHGAWRICYDVDTIWPYALSFDCDDDEISIVYYLDLLRVACGCALFTTIKEINRKKRKREKKI